MGLRDVLRSVPLFSDLSSEDLGRLATEATTSALEPGEVLFEEGDQGDVAYVISSGDVEVLKTSGPRQVLLALRGEGDVIGEMALLDAAPRMAAVRAKTSVELVAISKGSLDRLLDSSAGASRALFRVLLARWRETEAHLRQTERMAQLGTFTAGVAHELNNPAAAIVAGARYLTDAVDRHAAAVGNVRALGFDPEGHDLLRQLLEIARQPVAERGALERTDLEDKVERQLT
ncbi:MAG: cyclic nucleotide-binding domain-containing protein, partial [Acidimicrobiia bacterium]